eukprot:scaffold122063_cov43-Attheya_sp.AAC.1
MDKTSTLTDGSAIHVKKKSLISPLIGVSYVVEIIAKNFRNGPRAATTLVSPDREGKIGIDF